MGQSDCPPTVTWLPMYSARLERRRARAVANFQMKARSSLERVLVWETVRADGSVGFQWRSSSFPEASKSK